MHGGVEMTCKNRTSLLLGIIGVMFMSTVSCGGSPVQEEQDILLSFPKLSSMTVGQTHPFVVGLNLPADGTEILTAEVYSRCATVWPESQPLAEGETVKTFNITAQAPGRVVVHFSLGRLISKDLPIRVYPHPLP